MKPAILACLFLIAMLFSGRASADQCGGNLIEHKPVWVDGHKVGELQLYYNASNGNNCAVFAHAGPTWGRSLLTAVEVYVCKPMRDGLGYTDCAIWQWDPWWDRDEGWYSYRAGPVRVYGRDRCVKAMGYIKYQGETHGATTRKHCG